MSNNGAFFLQGPKGEQGETGPSFTITKVAVGVTVVSAATTIDLFVAAATGTLNIWGHINARDNSTNAMTAVVRINVTDQTAQGSTATVATLDSLPVHTQVAVTAGDNVRLRVTMDVYSSVAQIDSATLFYNIT